MPVVSTVLRVADVLGPSTRARLNKVIAAQLVKLLNDGFRKGVDPYGRPWAPLVSRAGKPLLHTGDLRGSYYVQTTPGGAVIRTEKSYAQYHQGGTRNANGTQRIPPRKMVPDGPGSLWEPIIEAKIDETLNKIFATIGR